MICGVDFWDWVVKLEKGVSESSKILVFLTRLKGTGITSLIS